MNQTKIARSTPRPPLGERFPRLRGAAAFGFGVLLAAINEVALHSGTLIPRVFWAAPVFILHGGWFMIVGAPKDRVTGATADWVEVGAWICGVLGMIVAIVLLLRL
jgi:hypothetical protein